MTESEVRKRFMEHAKEHGLCGAFRVFTLGSHGTVYVGCGLMARHELPLIDDEEERRPILFHQSNQGEPDGDLVIFRWPV